MAIKRIWDWIKALVTKLFRQSETEPTPHVPTDLEKRLGRKIQKRQAMGKPVDTRQGGPNMPKYQPHACGRLAKRNGKTMNGAYYWCAKCKSSLFLRAKGV